MDAVNMEQRGNTLLHMKYIYKGIATYTAYGDIKHYIL